MGTDDIDHGRRRLLIAATTIVGGIGAAYVATPFILSMDPSERAKAAGAPVDVDISKLQPGQMMTVEWRGKPVWILNRTQTMLDNMKTREGDLKDPNSDELSQQPTYCKNEFRAINPKYGVMIGICTHLGCSPTYRPELAPPDLGPQWKGGFFCPCHGSRYDLAGRVIKGSPAPLNLVVPPNHYITDTRVVVGVDPETA
jgi:ubiquinol-cytochrome c reductase iron-sulfur subunit